MPVATKWPHEWVQVWKKPNWYSPCLHFMLVGTVMRLFIIVTSSVWMIAPWSHATWHARFLKGACLCRNSEQKDIWQWHNTIWFVAASVSLQAPFPYMHNDSNSLIFLLGPAQYTNMKFNLWIIIYICIGLVNASKDLIMLCLFVCLFFWFWFYWWIWQTFYGSSID